MTRRARSQRGKSKRKAPTAKRRTTRSRPNTARKRSPMKLPSPSLSREVLEEILLHSAKSPEGQALSENALSGIAVCAGLDPAAVLDAHRRLRESVEEPSVTVLRVVGLWDPYD